MEQIQQSKNPIAEIEPVIGTLGEQESRQKSKKSWLLPVIILLIIGFIGSVVFAVYKVYRNTQVIEYLSESDENKIEVYYSEDSEEVDYNQIIEDGEELEVEGTADLPTPPDGMNWVYCSNVEAYLLSPNDWFKKEESTSSAEACFISRESIEYGGEFEVGLSVNLIRDVKAKTSQSNLEYAKSFIDKLAVELGGTIENGGDGVHFKGYSVGGSNEDASGSTVNLYYLALASMDTDKLYIFWYEGPSTEWTTLWPLGRDILMNLALESE